MNSRFLFALFIAVCGLAACDDTPDPGKVDAAFSRYFDTTIVIDDTLIDYRIEGDSLILHFPHPRKVSSWPVALGMDSFFTYPMNRKNEIVVEREEVRTFSDTETFYVQVIFMPNDSGFLFYKSSMDFVQPQFYSRPDGKLRIRPIKGPLYSFDPRVYTDLPMNLRKPVIDRFNDWNGFYTHNYKAWPYEVKQDSGRKARQIREYLPEDK